ncbi:26054_t:CDS:2, partial [Racocetra persica]
PFVIVTDHLALKWLQTSALKGKRARWILRLQPYNFTIVYQAGQTHNNTDALFRMVKDECNTFNPHQKAADMRNIDEAYKKDTILKPPQNPEDQAEGSTKEVEDEEEFEQYLENKRQHRELVQQLNNEFYGEIALTVQMGYQSSSESDHEIEIDINDEYIINSPK